MPEESVILTAVAEDLFWSFKKSRNGGSTGGWEVNTQESSGLGGRAEESLRVDAMRTKLHVSMAGEN